MHVLQGGRMEVRGEPFAGLAQFLFPPQFVEPQNQVGIVVGSLSRHEPIIPQKRALQYSQIFLSESLWKRWPNSLPARPGRRPCTARWTEPGGVLRLRPSLPHLPGLRGGVQGPLQSRRKAVRADGYVNAVHCDPIEKKPFFHALPGTRALSFGMLGCDLHCGYCQNWVSSQALRDIRSTLDFRPRRRGTGQPGVRDGAAAW